MPARAAPRAAGPGRLKQLETLGGQSLVRRTALAVLAADYGPTLGPPCLFPRAYLPELRALSGDRGAGALLRRHGDALLRLPMPHAGIDVDSPADLARVAELPAASR